MNIKKLPPWLKGGITSSVLLFILLVLILTGGDMRTFYIFIYSIWSMPLFEITPIPYMIVKLLGLNQLDAYHPVFLIMITCYTFVIGSLIGAFIGWIVRKIKSTRTV